MKLIASAELYIDWIYHLADQCLLWVHVQMGTLFTYSLAIMSGGGHLTGGHHSLWHWAQQVSLHLDLNLVQLLSHVACTFSSIFPAASKQFIGEMSQCLTKGQMASTDPHYTCTHTHMYAHQ